MYVVLAFSLILGPSFAQDFTVSYNTKANSASFEEFDFPEALTLFTIDMTKEKVAIDGLTFIQVWSECCGGEPEIWAMAREIEKKYGARGLKTLSINFENGTVLPEQIDTVKKYLKEVEPPEKLLLDPMGDVIEQLDVHGFPTYLLVSSDKKVFFSTNGKDPEGLRLMIEQLEKRLPPS